MTWPCMFEGCAAVFDPAKVRAATKDQAGYTGWRWEPGSEDEPGTGVHDHRVVFRTGDWCYDSDGAIWPVLSDDATYTGVVMILMEVEASEGLGGSEFAIQAVHRACLLPAAPAHVASVLTDYGERAPDFVTSAFRAYVALHKEAGCDLVQNEPDWTHSEAWGSVHD